jgi:hypothetical protein
MADGAAPAISPKQAIALGRQYFDDFMGDQAATRVLLEGLSIEDMSGNWVVTIGFDSERTKLKRTSIGGRQETELSQRIKQAFGEFQDYELIREFRAIHLSSGDGSFVKLEHA